MAKTVNGWTVDPPTRTITAGGRTTAVRSGDVATVLQYVAQRFHADVEKLTTFHGYRSSRTNSAIGGDSGSNHISGTAIDLNGWKHPYEGGKGWRDQGFTAAQIVQVREILAKVNGTSNRYAGVVQWGYDYTPGWRDGMHFQIRAGSSAAAVRAAAKRVTKKPSHTRKTTANVRLRAAPGLHAREVRTLPKGYRFTVLDGSGTFVDDLWWVKTTRGNWIAGKYTKKV